MTAGIADFSQDRDQAMDYLLLATSVLVVPLALLLFAQWPLREWVQAWSRQANDAAQVVFAVYVAVAITAASRANTHLAAVRTTDHSPKRGRRAAIWRAGLVLACVGPWVVFMLWASAPMIAASVMRFDKFGASLMPGYFVIKLAMGLMLVLVLIDAMAGWLAAWRHP